MNPTVPSIDFKSFLCGSSNDRLRIAAEIDEALGCVGFVQLRNHGIEQYKVDECFKWSQRLFALSESEKASIRPCSPSYNHGYSGVGDEKVRGRVCLKESFDCGNPEDHERHSRWPEENLLPGFRHFMEDFFQDCSYLIHQLLQCLSLALNLSSEDSFDQHHARSLFDLSFLHYPTIFAPSGGLTRSPAHSDFGTLTLLFQDSVGGLEIADTSSTSSERSADVEKSGKFIHIDPNPGRVLINVGYLLMRWSNGRWKNTIHRVSEPPRCRQKVLEGSDCNDKTDGSSASVEAVPERYSIAFFSAPDPATVIEPLQCCCGTQPPRWKPINTGEYLRKKRAAIYHAQGH